MVNQLTPLQNPQLDGNPFYWENSNKVGILLIHGFTATTAEVQPLGRYLHQAGFSVSGPLLDGHATTPSDLNKCTWQNWSDNVEVAYQQLKSKCNLVFVGGESMGGLLTLELANRHPEIRGLLLYAAALMVPGMYRSILLSPFFEFLPKKHLNEKIAWQGYRVNPLKAVSQLFYLQQNVKKILPHITQPTLICQGLLDETVDSRTPEYIQDHIHSTQKELHWFSNSGHCILLDKELELISKISLDFIHRYI